MWGLFNRAWEPSLCNRCDIKQRFFRCVDRVNTNDGVEAHLIRMAVEKTSLAQRRGPWGLFWEWNRFVSELDTLTALTVSQTWLVDAGNVRWILHQLVWSMVTRFRASPFTTNFTAENECAPHEKKNRIFGAHVCPITGQRSPFYCFSSRFTAIASASKIRQDFKRVKSQQKSEDFYMTSKPIISKFFTRGSPRLSTATAIACYSFLGFLKAETKQHREASEQDWSGRGSRTMEKISS
jgi:hypothetical protein